MPRPLIRLIAAAVLLVTVAAVLLSRHLISGRQPAISPSVATPVTELATPIATDPASAVTLGEQFERDGDDASAIAQLRPFVGRGTPATDAQVRLVLARVLLEAGRAADARDAAQALRSAYPSSAQADLAQFILAEALDQLGDHQGAITAFRAFDARHPGLDAYMQLRIADSLKADNRLDDAQRTAEVVAGKAPIPAVAIDALDRIRAIQTIRGDFHGYLATTSRLLGVATTNSYRTQLTFERAWAEQAIGDTQAAIADYRAVVESAPDSSYAPRAVTGLAQLNASDAVSPEQRGIVLYDSGQYRAAIDLFTSAIQANPHSDTAWYYRALSRLRSGDDSGAEADLQGLPQGFPNSQYVPAALYRAGRLLEENGQPDEARTTYQTLVDRYATAPEAVDGRFRLGLLAYMKGDYSGAARFWSATGLSGANAARADYWLAKARIAQNDRKGAQPLLLAAVSADPDGYYGLRAQDLMGGDAAAASPVAAIPPPAASPLASPAADGALASWYGAQGTDAGAARAAVLADPGYQRAALLLDLGLRSEAVDEIDALSARVRGAPAALASLAALLTERGDLRIAYPVGRMAISAARARSLPVPPQIEALAYPTPYAAQVATSAGRHGVDPLLLLALMKQESGYVPSARSPAGALGLTQVMPDTGRSIARSLGIADWQPDQLLRPDVSIDFGADYLAEQIKRFGGRLFPAIAAYNAGNGAVDGWLKDPHAADPDVFAELIPYPETHDYLQIVYANYLHYVRAYRSHTR